MTNEEAKVFLDNLKLCINEHPIVADWLVEIADRKTEPQTDDKKRTYAYDKYSEEWYPIYAKRKEDEPQTDCSWKKGE